MNREECIAKLKQAEKFVTEKHFKNGLELCEYEHEGMITDNDDVCQAVNQLSLEEIPDYMMINYMGRYNERINKEGDNYVVDFCDDMTVLTVERLSQIMNVSDEEWKERYNDVYEDMIANL